MKKDRMLKGSKIMSKNIDWWKWNVTWYHIKKVM